MMNKLIVADTFHLKSRPGTTVVFEKFGKNKLYIGQKLTFRNGKESFESRVSGIERFLRAVIYESDPVAILIEETINLKGWECEFDREPE